MGMLLRTRKCILQLQGGLFESSRHRIKNHSRHFKIFSRDRSALVYRSLSTDPFVNLAFEDWTHENFDATNILFLWRNVPTVVIGRHQNPWNECKLELMKSLEINLARRKSGGGTVYHDLGNVNCTFFTDRVKYNRKQNLEFIANHLRHSYNFDVTVNNRDDLILDGCFKISGTAAKLSLKKAYHHCTLLCAVDKTRIDSVLKPSYSGINSNATSSVRSKTKNLFGGSQEFNWEELTTGLAEAFLNKYNCKLDHATFIDVNPLSTEQSSMITKLKHEISDWTWIYGKTPKFHYDIEREFPFGKVSCKMMIKNGMIEDIKVNTESNRNDEKCSILWTSLIGSRFNRTEILAVICQNISNFPWNSSQDELICKEISEWVLSCMH
eukprot:Seg10491.1 transcript_id=Seg10491.1/GoldUCD/mRNA.D3Y31 product="Lipoyltransferase 1 mitochondrial" protein_id=Seg10491.1/GoldUCD/D3Y31